MIKFIIGGLLSLLIINVAIHSAATLCGAPKERMSLHLSTIGTITVIVAILQFISPFFIDYLISFIVGIIYATLLRVPIRRFPHFLAAIWLINTLLSYLIKYFF